MDVLKLHAEYMNAAFGDLNYIADDLRRRLTGGDAPPVEVDTLVGIGLSGAPVVPFVARVLDYRWLVVRKDYTHSSYPFEGELGKRWLFVDDRIETGETLKRVRETIEAAAKSYGRNGNKVFKSTYVGYYVYQRQKLLLA